MSTERWKKWVKQGKEPKRDLILVRGRKGIIHTQASDRMCQRSTQTYSRHLLGQWGRRELSLSRRRWGIQCKVVNAFTLDYRIHHTCLLHPVQQNRILDYGRLDLLPGIIWLKERVSWNMTHVSHTSEEDVYKYLTLNFNNHDKWNRAPLDLFYHQHWFQIEAHKKGFKKFLKDILVNNDVYLVTTWQAIEWMTNPTPLSEILVLWIFQETHRRMYWIQILLCYFFLVYMNLNSRIANPFRHVKSA